MKKLHLLTLSALALLAAPAASFAQASGVWTSPCSASTTLDHMSLMKYSTVGSSLLFGPTRTGTIVARYNVTNTSVPSDLTPAWGFLQFGYTDLGAGTATATLYEVTPCTGAIEEICQVNSDDLPGQGVCNVCQFATTQFDFVLHLYYVEVKLTRPDTASVIQANTLRIF